MEMEAPGFALRAAGAGVELQNGIVFVILSGEKSSDAQFLASTGW